LRVTLPLFVYGTLLDEIFVANLLERAVGAEPARLLDFELLALEGFPYPLAFFAPGETLAGRLYRDLTDDDYARLDHYEGVNEELYQRVEASAVVGKEAPESVFVYVPTEKTLRRQGVL
jgi:gamma-glutamylcyclotransferase (GGCT)/AIG2-like uncharacterized protein YtfP